MVCASCMRRCCAGFGGCCGGAGWTCCGSCGGRAGVAGAGQPRVVPVLVKERVQQFLPVRTFFRWGVSLEDCLLILQKITTCNAFLLLTLLNLNFNVLALHIHYTMIKKKRKFSSYIRKFIIEQLQSHIWPTASSYLSISSYIRKHFLINDFSTAPLWISLHMRKISFYFLSVYCEQYCACLGHFLAENSLQGSR